MKEEGDFFFYFILRFLHLLCYSSTLQVHGKIQSWNENKKRYKHMSKRWMDEIRANKCWATDVRLTNRRDRGGSSPYSWNRHQKMKSPVWELNAWAHLAPTGHPGSGLGSGSQEGGCCGCGWRWLLCQPGPHCAPGQKRQHSDAQACVGRMTWAGTCGGSVCSRATTGYHFILSYLWWIVGATFSHSFKYLIFFFYDFLYFTQFHTSYSHELYICQISSLHIF